MAWSGQEVCSGFALAACTMPLQLGLCSRGLRYALAACATPLRLGLCPCGLRYALRSRGSGFTLAAWLCPRDLHYALAAWAAAATAVAAAAVEATEANACPCGSRYPLAGLGFALAARLCPLRPRGSRYTLMARLRPNTTIKQQSSGRKSCFGSAATYLPQR